VDAAPRQIADWLAASKFAVVLTGAGVSTESGIPDFRSPGGVWSRRRPVMFDEYLRDPQARIEYWQQRVETHAQFDAARPNVAHCVFARWEQAGRICAMMTQNIDGLHQAAGSRAVLELHGTAQQVACLDCGDRRDAAEMIQRFQQTGEVPLCTKCGGLTKHATISFGQSLNAEVLRSAMRWSREADLFFAIGSSLVVTPAAELPALAKESGARLVIINREPTPLDTIADLVVHSAIGSTIEKIDDLLKMDRGRPDS
jgi:NAD-dependent deacetylase